VTSHLDDARAVENDDEVGHAHRAEAVGDENGDPAVGSRGRPISSAPGCGGKALE
jgi:hypothetical protein